MHELLRTISMESWEAIQKGKPNSMTEHIEHNATIRTYLTLTEIRQSFDVTHHVGDAPSRARKLAGEIQKIVKKHE
jgi:adenylosuccinate lyase